MAKPTHGIIAVVGHFQLGLRGVFQVRLDLGEVFGADQRTHAVLRIERVTHFPFADIGAHALQQLILDRCMDQQPGSGRAVLAHVPEGAVDHLFGDQIEVFGIIHDHGWVLAAALQDDSLEVGVRGIMQEPTARGGRASEANHVDVRVQAD